MRRSYPRYRPPKPQIDETLLLDRELRKILRKQLDVTCLGDQLGSTISNLPEFIEGVIEEEDLMGKEVDQMERWRGVGSVDDRICKVWLNEQRGVLCARFPYDSKTIDDFKLSIPKGKKSWNSEEKIWEFSVEVIDLLIEILEKNFPGKVVDLTQAISPPPQAKMGDQLMDLLDEEDIKRIRRFGSLRHHPDRGGDESKMARINEVLSRSRICGK